MHKFTSLAILIIIASLLIGNQQNLYFSPPTNQQQLPCNLSVIVTATPSIICEAELINLEAISTNGEIIRVNWTPENLVNNPNDAITTANVNATTTFEVSISSLDDENLIVNGDFTNGLNNFTSDYIPGTGGAAGLLTNEGEFAIAVNAADTHTGFEPCNEPSNNGGNMLVVNGAGIANQDIWCQTINVSANTNYGFSVLVASVTSSAPAQLQISVNGSIFGSIFNASSSTCFWTQFSQFWESDGATTSADICIVNQNTAASGNDFAIDDIIFSEICTAMNQVTVTLEEIDATWTPPINICLNSTDIVLNNLLTSTATPGGSWTVDGQPSEIFSPQISGSGAFDIVYTAGSANCQESISQFIIVNPLPDPSWINPGPLHISAQDIILNDLLIPAALPGGSWTINGSPASVFSASALGSGEYEVSYTVGASPCENTLSYIITIYDTDCDAAEVTIDSVAPICLTQNTMPFELNTTIVGDPGVGLWDGTGITDIQAGTFNPQVAGEGIHLITHTYVTTQCNVLDTIFIEIIEQPIASFTGLNVLCISDTLAITFDGTASPSANYEWNFFDGNVISGTGEGPYNIQWDTSGIHLVQLVVTDGDCTSNPFFLNVQVDALLDTPIIECFSTFTSISYEWNLIENATAYLVSVINGPLGMITSDTSYLISDLVPGQTIDIQMVVVSNNACPGSINLPVCTSTYCLDTLSVIIPFGPICIDETPDTIYLQHNIPDSLSEFSATWSGLGVIDSILIIDSSMLGTNEVYLLLDSDICTLYDTLSFEVTSGPEADFDLPAAVCVNDTIDIIFTGTTTMETTFDWSLDGGMLVNPGNNDTLQVFWGNGGTKDIILQLTDDSCDTEPTSQQIEIQVPLNVPIINCESTFSSILFTWQEEALASGFEVNVIQGPPGILTTDTSYLIQNLIPEQEIEFEVIFYSSNSCSNVSTLITCNTLPCPIVNLEIIPIAPICFEETDTLQLELGVSMGIDTGLLYWTGTGIIDSINGLFLLDSSRIGQNNQVIVFYEEGICVFSDTISIEVSQQPNALFSLSDSLCLSDAATVFYTGNASANAIFNWSFENANISSASDIGPHELHWSTSGNFIVSLSVEENNCISETYSDSIEVIAPLSIPQPGCNSTLTSINVSWPAIPNASSYELNLDQNFTINWLSDTSITILNLIPDTTLDFTLIALGAAICGNTEISFSCTTASCEAITFDWLASNETICLGDQTTFHFTTSTIDSFSITLVNGTDTAFINNITDGDSLVIQPNVSNDYTIIAIENQNDPFCLPETPAAIQVVVNEPLEAGEALDIAEICSGLDNSMTLSNQISNFQNGGIWSETSNLLSPNGAFDSNVGTFSTSTVPVGTYTFEYILSAPSPCPEDVVEVQVIINETPIADAGEDLNLGCLFNEGSIGSSNTSTGNTIEIEWSSQNGTPISTPNQAIIDVNQADTFLLSVTNTVTGCSQNDFVYVNSDIAFLVPHTSISNLSCFDTQDGIISIDSITGGLPPYLISFNESDLSNQMVFSGLSAGNYHLFIVDANGCQTDLTLDLTAPDQLIVHIVSNIAGGEETLQQGDELILEALVNRTIEEIDTIQWTPDTLLNGNPFQVIDSPWVTSTYTVNIIDLNGCTAGDILTIYVNKERHVFIPNSFSPNGDNSNNVFMIFAGKGVKTIKSFNIFNRWGEQIFQDENFQANDPAHGWDGYFQGKLLNSGVFVYVAEIEMIDGEIVIFKGDVTLLK